MNSLQIKESDQRNVMGTYGRFDLVIDHGQGAKLYDLEGKEYIDFGAGIGVSSLGHNDSEWVAAVSGQAAKIGHTSNLYYNVPSTLLAQELCAASGMSKMIFCNSGAEANEIAIKVARKHSFMQKGKGYQKILTLQNSFHGRTVTTLSATGQDVFHQYFFPFTEGFSHVSPTDLEQVRAAIDETVCAIMIEVVQGEGGVVALEPDYVKGIEQLCREKGLTFIVDEVQAGMGRCGALFAYQRFGVHPDVVSVAKGLGGGLPIGGVLVNNEYDGVMGLSDHGTTFGANPVCAAAGRVVLRRLTAPGFFEEVQKKGAYVKERIGKHPLLKEIRGLGLMLGVDFEGIDSKKLAQACLKNGLVILTAKSAVRLLPPLTITMEELDAGLSILEQTLDELSKQQG